jgi:predicted patatin/cPLA2 family phospholipase
MEKSTFELKNIELVKIWRTSEKLANATGGSVKFKFSMVVNRNILKPLVEAIDVLQKPSEGITEYSSKYNAINKAFESAELPREQVESEITNLNEEYKVSLEERLKQLTEFEKFLNETQSVDLYSLSPEDVLAAFESVDPKQVTPEDISIVMLLSK